MNAKIEHESVLRFYSFPFILKTSIDELNVTILYFYESYLRS